MAGRKKSPQAENRQLELKISRADAQLKLEARIQKGRELKARQISTAADFQTLEQDVDKWDAFNCALLKNNFTTEDFLDEYCFWGAVEMSMYEPSPGQKLEDIRSHIDTRIHRLASIIERLELIPVSSALAQTLISSTESQSNSASQKKVFIVHGREEVAKTNLEVFVRENGLEPIVLHRQADEGLTIIEKFEKHSDVGYAFILLTPDEIAYLAPDDKKPDDQRKKELRARPNVIFEFGYFVGKLGRSRVCCLHTGGVTVPSDVNGMVYKAYHSSIEEVAYSILKDLRAAGYDV